MPIFEIEGPADPRLVPYRNLKSGHHTPDSFIVESQRLVERLLLSSFHKHSILTTEKRIRIFKSTFRQTYPSTWVPKRHYRKLLASIFTEVAWPTLVLQARKWPTISSEALAV